MRPRRALANEPSVQSSYMKNLVAALTKLGHVSAVRAADPTLFEEIEAAARMGWLPVECNVRMVEALAGCFGEKHGLEVLTDSLYSQFDTPLWNNFVKGAIRLLGREPDSLGRWIPQAFSLVFRGCGAWSVQADGDCALDLEGTDLPQDLIDHRLWLESVAKGMQTIFAICEVKGESELCEVDSGARRVRIRLTWEHQEGEPARMIPGGTQV